MDRFSKACLSLIVGLLAVIAFRPAVAPPVVHAAQATEYSYYYIGTSRLDDIQQTLPKLSSAGWRVVGMTTIGQYNNQVLFVLAK